MTKSFGMKAWALAAGLGLSVVLVSGCNPEEPATKPAPPTTPPAVKAPAKADDAKGAAPAPAPADKKDEAKKPG